MFLFSKNAHRLKNILRLTTYNVTQTELRYHVSCLLFKKNCEKFCTKKWFHDRYNLPFDLFDKLTATLTSTCVVGLWFLAANGTC